MARLKNTLFCLMALACYIANKCIDAVKLRHANETINLCPGMMYAVICTKYSANANIVFALRNKTIQRPQLQDTFSNYLGSYDIAKGETNTSGLISHQNVYLILKNLRAEDDGKQFTCAYDNDSTRRKVDEHFEEGYYVKLQILPSTVCDAMYKPPVAVETTKDTQPTTISSTTSEEFTTSMRVTYKQDLPKPTPGGNTNDKDKCTGKSTNIVANTLVTFLVAIFALAMLVV